VYVLTVVDYAAGRPRLRRGRESRATATSLSVWNCML